MRGLGVRGGDGACPEPLVCARWRERVENAGLRMSLWGCATRVGDCECVVVAACLQGVSLVVFV